MEFNDNIMQLLTFKLVWSLPVILNTHIGCTIAHIFAKLALVLKTIPFVIKAKGVYKYLKSVLKENGFNKFFWGEPTFYSL